MDAETQRYLALAALFDYSKGTLWWVSNHIWNKVIRHFVWKKGSQSHPGLSIARRKAADVHDVIPMLIGTTRVPLDGTPVLTVVDIDPENHPAPTYFSPLRPQLICFDEFGRSDRRIRANGPKRRLAPDEMQLLDEILLAWEE